MAASETLVERMCNEALATEHFGHYQIGAWSRA
jgi:hypothetical protein